MNVVTLGILLVLLLFSLVLWMEEPASAHFTGGSSVDCVEKPNCELRYQNHSRYSTEVAHSDSAWSALAGRVTLAPDITSTLTDVDVIDATNQCDATWVGRTMYVQLIADTIELNVCNFNQSGYNLFERKGTTAHEFGHALGLDHSYKPNIMYTPSRNTGNNTPQTHDRQDYYTLWR